MDKFFEGLKKMSGVLTAAVAILGIVYGLIVKAGFVISRAEAQTMVDLAVQSSAAQTNGLILDEVKARQKADYQFQLDDINDDIAALLDEDELSKGQEYELEQLKQKAAKLEAALTALEQ